MNYECTLKRFEAATIRELRIKFDKMRPYLDDEIASAYSLYCELFHAAGWTETDLAKFVQWATETPMNTFSRKSPKPRFPAAGIAGLQAQTFDLTEKAMNPLKAG